MRVKDTTAINTSDDISNSTKKKSNNMPLIPANKKSLWAKLLKPILFGNIEKNFYSVKIKNKENFYSGNPEYSRILYGMHNCFYDGQLAYYFCRKVFNANFYLMIQELYRLPQLAAVGGFSVEKNSPYEAVKSLNYASNLLKDKENMLWLFPQGKVMPPDYMPLKFESGLSYICNKVKKVNVIPVAIKYTFVRQEKPEIFIEIGKPTVIDNGVRNKKELTGFLEDDLSSLVNNQLYNISTDDCEEYETVYQNKLSLYRRMESHLKKILPDKRFLKK